MERIDFKCTLYWDDIQLDRRLIDFCYANKDKNSYYNEDLTDQLVPLLFPVPMFADVAKELNYTSYDVVKMWIQHYNPGDNHSVHVHGPNSQDWSFICYVQCTEDSSETVFYNPGYPYMDIQQVRMKPKAGRVCLFNGGLPHEVLQNRDTTRMIVSGNLVFRNDNDTQHLIKAMDLMGHQNFKV